MNGLSDKEVLESRRKYGTNEITGVKRDSFFKLLLESLGDPIIRILLIALGIKTVFLISDFDWYETVGIVIAIFIASFISSISEYGSSKAFQRLQEESAKIKCRVRRNGEVTEVSIDDVVMGDVLILNAGDKIGADGVIIRGSVDVDESSMNGEAATVSKGRNDVIYRGCVIYNGYAEALINKIGNNTYYGKMVGELSEKSEPSPLKERLNKLAMIISKIGYICAGLVSVSYLFSKIFIENNFVWSDIVDTVTDISLMFAYLLHALTLSVTIIVVSVPEGLPMMITLVLSSNMKRMLKNNVLVRKLVGIETAGSMNILFTDKTGTLTRGKLEVVSFMLGNKKYYDGISKISGRYRKLFIDSLVYNNESVYDHHNNCIVGGNITDKAIMEFVKTSKNSDVEIIDNVYFDSKNKYSMVITNEGGKVYKYVKGASEVILDKCDRYYDENGVKQLLLHKEVLEKEINDITSRGIRVVCVAMSNDRDKSLRNLVLVGFLLIRDDIRKESIEGVRLIKRAGIGVVMITGDNKNTAVSIAKEVGIIDDDSNIVIDSNKLSSMSDEEVKDILPKLRVVARAMPNDKSRLVRIAKECGLVVGMTGDGVNDAIALKKADVGISLGSGTEVAKEASDIVILDDNILSIAKAILYGRTIFKSIRKFIIFQLTVNFCAVSISIIGPFIGIPHPVTVIQMLWVNMVMDTLAGLAFSYEPPLLEYMEELPKKRDEHIINKYMLNEIIVMGLYSSLICFIFLKSGFIRGLYRASGSNEYLMTAFFGLFIFISIFNSFNARTYRLNIFANILKNKVFLGIIIFIVIVQVMMIYYGGGVFRTSGLTLYEFMVMMMVAVSVIPADFIRKVILKKKNCEVGV